MEAVYARRKDRQIRRSVARRAALYGSNAVSSRAEIKRVMRRAYKLCSDAVHTGKLNLEADDRNVIKEASSIVTKAISRQLCEISPNWIDIENNFRNSRSGLCSTGRPKQPRIVLKRLLKTLGKWFEQKSRKI